MKPERNVLVFSTSIRNIALSATALLVFMNTSANNFFPQIDNAGPAPLVSDSLPLKKKSVTTVDVNRTKNEVTITYADGAKETLTEQEAHRQGLVHNGGYGNFKQMSNGVGETRIRVKSDSTKPVFVLEGREINPDDMNNISPNNIESINVLKGQAAIDKYGVKGRNGVVEVLLKKIPFDEWKNDLNNVTLLRKWMGLKEGDEIQSYSLVKHTVDEDVRQIEVKGSELTPAAKKFLKQLKTSETLVVDKIMVKRDGVLINLPTVYRRL
ncbi:MAG TPA: TonB-dependent receptor plug domain-containing protein [Flavisolibacter sp.]|nr:TonB-dependent receptor plug domain-containing protein [Flavisolibacter sp.]